MTITLPKHWQQNRQEPLPSDYAEKLHPLIRELLWQRRIDKENITDFLAPSFKLLPEPEVFKAMSDATTVILNAIKTNRPLVIYGDYDVDGITGTASLVHTLRYLGARVGAYIPHRMKNGYGLKTTGIDEILADAEKQSQQRLFCPPGDFVDPVLVTVDCGMTAASAVTYAKQKGFEVVVTDHHEFDENDMPQCVCLHPRFHVASEDKYMDGNHICGSAMAWFLCWHLLKSHYATDKLPPKARELLIATMAFAGMGSIADVIGLIGPSRQLASYGLKLLPHSPFVGVQALIEVSGLKNKALDETSIGFTLAPKINATGRMDSAMLAYELLATDDTGKALMLAKKFNKLNNWRQEVTRVIQDKAEKQVVKESRGILVHGPMWNADWKIGEPYADQVEVWHPGVVGIVAGRLAEKHAKPTLVLCHDTENNMIKGSARSVQGCDLLESLLVAIKTMGGLQAGESCGGHAQAAGIALSAERLPVFAEAWQQALETRWQGKDKPIAFTYDIATSLASLDKVFYKQLRQMSPFGPGNAKPIIVTSAKVTLMRPMGKEAKHLQMQLMCEDSQQIMRAVAFGDKAALVHDLNLREGQAAFFALRPVEDEWQGRLKQEVHVENVAAITF